jgi:hypothetical protein|tara:strand:- start:42 stop:239 length:198 start_codon:yes stop_codon:yes gene_type:complete
MEVYILYKTDDRTIISFILREIYDEYIPAEGHSVTSNYLEYDEDELPYLDKVSVDENGIGSKIEE